MSKIYTTAVTKDRVANDPQAISISPEYCFARSELKTFSGGLYCKVPVSASGSISSVALYAAGVNPSGTCMVALANPEEYPEAAFLSVVIDEVPVVSVGEKMYRLTNIEKARYATHFFTPGVLYFLLVSSGFSAGTKVNVNIVIDAE
jgi:hypothetical protein